MPEQVYLDHAATTQMPAVVLEAMEAYIRGGRGNPYRGLHALAERATLALEEARAQLASFIGADPAELVFTKSTTEGLNLVAQSLGNQLGPGDEVVLTIFEHHANLLPWRELSKARGFTLRYLPMDAQGSIDLKLARQIIGPRTKVLGVMHASNVLGTILPVRELAKLAHDAQALVIVDAAQSVAHLPIDVHELEADALAFGAHKMYGPEGIGALFVSERLRPRLKPLLYGGGMVDEVLDDDIRYADDLRLLEAGSPNVAGAVGFAAACEYLQELDLGTIKKHEDELVNQLVTGLAELPGVIIHSPNPPLGRVGIVSFSLAGIHAHDVAQILADEGIAVRAGYHCAAPLTRCVDPSGTVRVSFGVDSSSHDLELLLAAVRRAQARFL